MGLTFKKTTVNREGGKPDKRALQTSNFGETSYEFIIFIYQSLIKKKNTNRTLREHRPSLKHRPKGLE